VPRLRLLAHPAVRSAIARELGRDIEYHERIGSTQTRARALVTASATAGVVVADAQEAGQGTRGRSWVAPAGTSLLASWIFQPAPVAPAMFAALAGLAVARALDALGRPGALLKWPNDVELDGQKLAGVLAHGTSDGRGGSLVLGIGINVHQRREDLAPEIQSLATSLAIVGVSVDRLALLDRVTRELDRVADARTLAASRDAWTARSSILGRPVTVGIDGRAPFSGTATAIDDEGALLVHTASGVERVVSGEVRRA
jgi:BirA family biotin operon repressor/biotin-[acetyl-CoA-carboxylase] ligase